MSAPRVSDHVVNTLARVIADAKAGSVHAVAIVAVDPTGRPLTYFAGAGDLVPHINLGLDMVKGTFLQQVLQAPAAATMNSGLIVPGNDTSN